MTLMLPSGEETAISCNPSLVTLYALVEVAAANNAERAVKIIVRRNGQGEIFDRRASRTSDFIGSGNENPRRSLPRRSLGEAKVLTPCRNIITTSWGASSHNFARTQSNGSSLSTFPT